MTTIILPENSELSWRWPDARRLLRRLAAMRRQRRYPRARRERRAHLLWWAAQMHRQMV